MNILRDYALQFVGLQYKWAGDDTILGYDCSGFIQELLASVGVDPPGDQTAQLLFDFFSVNGTWNSCRCGALAFYGRSTVKVSHVAMLLDPYRVIEAGGGGSKTHTKADAARDNAYIRVRPLDARSDRLAVIRPHYVKIGQI